MAPIGALVPALAVATVKATGLLIAAFAVTTSMKRRSAAVRHAVWTAALAATVLLPIAGTTLPPLPIPVLAAPVTDTVPRPAATLRLSVPAHSVAGAHTAAVPRSPGRVAGGLAWMDAAVLAWLTGALVLVLRTCGGAVGVRRLARRARPATDARVIRRVGSLSCRLGVRRRVAARVSPGEWIPMARGVLRPALLLPAAVTTWSDARLDRVLLHELAHVARLDVVSHLVARLAVALFWFNPLVWLAARQARFERERACDDVVLASGTSPSSYAEDLLALATSLAMPSCGGAAMAMAGRAPLQRRIAAILVEGNVNRNRLSRSAAVALVTAILAVTPLIGAARLVAGTPSALPPLAAALALPVPPSPITKPSWEGASKSNDARPRVTGTAQAPAVAPAQAPTQLAAQAPGPRPPVDFSGRWIPDDADRVQAWFVVGLTRHPGSGMTITQDATTLTLHTSFPSIQGHERTAVYRLDGTESTTNLGPFGIINGPETSRARWDGDRLVITTTRPNSDRELQETYSMDGGQLTIECVTPTYREVRRFHRKDGDREKGAGRD
jgi:beta-lactamase regulating signal transducer with metallopeptidase domain